MAYTFLSLTNRILTALNEVPLTSSNFSTAVGFQLEAQNYIQMAVLDILRVYDYQWPFLYTNNTFNTVIGQKDYTANASAFKINWDTFQIRKQFLSIASLTQTGGVATAVVTNGHQLITGDTAIVQNAFNTGYNGNPGVSVSNPTTFTYNVASTLTSPDSGGSPTVSPPYVSERLKFLDYDRWVRDRMNKDIDSPATLSYEKPRWVVQTPNNQIILSPVPDRIYTVYYDYFTTPTPLSAYSDIPIIPSQFEQVIVDGAMYKAYLFRDNPEEAQLALNEYNRNLFNMRRTLIPQQEFMTFTD